MIEPKVMEFSEGEYVLHSDYARLKAEVERLTKAGDAMAGAMYGSDLPILVCEELTNNWNAVRKGGQP